MTECSICGWEMLSDDGDYYDGQLVHCDNGHIAMVSCCRETPPHTHDAESASEWVRRLVHAFPRGDSRRDDIRVIVEAVRRLELLE